MSFSFPSSSSSSSSYDNDYSSSSSSSSSSSGGPSSSYFSKLTSSFGSSDVSSSKDFLESNTFIAKTAFLLLVIILFFIFLRISIGLLSWLLAPSQNMTLLNGMADATLPIQITQDPSSTSSMPIIRSSNQILGMEFTWSVWMFIKPTQQSNATQHVFSKGAGSKMDCTAAGVFSNNAPGVYLTGVNTLNVLMDTVTQPACSVVTSGASPTFKPTISIGNMPINKWFNVVIRLTNDTLDVYINGRLTQRTILASVPNQNYDDVFICSGTGYNGYISDLKYFNSAIGTTQINALVSNGPNTSINSSNLKNNIPPYLSIDWYQDNQN
jgi:hypothetical protein